MCVKPLRIFNNSHTINSFVSRPLINFVPCGQCCECQSSRVNQYFARSYYESIQTFNRGGYVLFDTLTYSDINVPNAKNVLSDIIDTSKLSGFMCFDRRDFTLFMKRLRKRLFSAGYDYRNIKYLVTGEYGTSEIGTHRPHLHCLFFVQNSNIPPAVLSHLINLSWQKGRTDGIDYRGFAYFNSNSLIRCDNSNLLATLYVTKYVAKDSSYQSVLNSRLSYLRQLVISQHERGYSRTYEFRLLMNRVKRAINQFTLTSQNFGSFIYDFFGVDKLINDNYITFPFAGEVVKKIPIPRYIVRKYFYTYDKSSKSYLLNDDGIRYCMKSNKDNISLLSDRYSNLIANSSALGYPEFAAALVRDKISLSSLSRYQLFYSNRVLSPRHLDVDYINENQYNDNPARNFYMLNTLRDSYANGGRMSIVDGEIIPTSEFIQRYAFHYKPYDDIIAVLDKLSRLSKFDRQKVYDDKQRLSKIYHFKKY